MCGGLSAGDHETRQGAGGYTSCALWDGQRRKYLGDTSNVLWPGGARGVNGTSYKDQAGLEKCDPGSPLEEAVNDQDGATMAWMGRMEERGVDWKRAVPGSLSKRNEVRSKTLQALQALQALHGATASPAAGVPASWSKLPRSRRVAESQSRIAGREGIIKSTLSAGRWDGTNVLGSGLSTHRSGS